MKYLQIDIETNKEDIEPLTGFLLTRGITDTVIEDPDDLENLLIKKKSTSGITCLRKSWI